MLSAITLRRQVRRQACPRRSAPHCPVIDVRTEGKSTAVLTRLFCPPPPRPHSPQDLMSKIFRLTAVLHLSRSNSSTSTVYVWLIPLGLVSGDNRRGDERAVARLCGPRMGHITCTGACLFAIALALPVGIFPAANSKRRRSRFIDFAEHAASPHWECSSYYCSSKCFYRDQPQQRRSGQHFSFTDFKLWRVAWQYFRARLLRLIHNQLPFAVLAMAGTLTASVKAPITSMMLVIEMTGSLIAHMLRWQRSNFFGCFRCAQNTAVYHALLNRFMKSSKPTVDKASQSALISLPVELDSAATGKAIGKINWPEHTAVIFGRRGGKEFVPRATNGYSAGDGIVVMYTGEHQRQAREELNLLCSSAY